MDNLQNNPNVAPQQAPQPVQPNVAQTPAPAPAPVPQQVPQPTRQVQPASPPPIQPTPTPVQQMQPDTNQAQMQTGGISPLMKIFIVVGFIVLIMLGILVIYGILNYGKSPTESEEVSMISSISTLFTI